MFGTIYRNCWQAIKVRAVLWFLTATAALCAGFAVALFPRYGIGVSALLLGIGLVPLAGMLLYVRRYVTEIRIAGEVIEIDTLSLTGNKTSRVPRSTLKLSSIDYGRPTTSGGIHVNAPYISLRSERMRFLVDLQAEEIDQLALETLLFRTD
jgi:hypothetical protein